MKRTTMTLKTPENENYFTIIETEYGFAIYADPEQTRCVLTIGDNGKGLLLATKNGSYTNLDLVKPVREVFPEVYDDIKQHVINNTILKHTTDYRHRIYIIPESSDDDDNALLARVFYVDSDGTAFELLNVGLKDTDFSSHLQITCKGLIANPF